MPASSRRGALPATSMILFLAVLLLLQTVVRACLPLDGMNAGVTLNRGTHVCVVLSTPEWVDGTSNYSRLAFTPNVDKFARLQFSDTYSNVPMGGITDLYGPNVAVHVESMGVTSFQKLYRQEDPLGRTFPILTAIINLDRGVVTGITFDNGCVLCNNSDRCVENTYDFLGELYSGVGATSDCFLTDAECAANTQADPRACQLTVYVTWTGTDAKGNFLTSSSRRFSLFSSYSVNSYVNGLVKGV
ncbi:Hypothetical protein NocV09_01501510 [Nannochloropsis oceanica]